MPTLLAATSLCDQASARHMIDFSGLSMKKRSPCSFQQLVPITTSAGCGRFDSRPLYRVLGTNPELFLNKFRYGTEAVITELCSSS